MLFLYGFLLGAGATAVVAYHLAITAKLTALRTTIANDAKKVKARL